MSLGQGLGNVLSLIVIPICERPTYEDPDLATFHPPAVTLRDHPLWDASILFLAPYVRLCLCLLRAGNDERLIPF